MKGVNLTECGHCSDVSVDAEFTTIHLVVTACGAYCAGIVSVLLVVFILKLKKEKKMCFREAEEPFRGKWEGASQKATIQVLKKHTLEKSQSYDKSKSMETSVEANEVLIEAANQVVKSVEEGGIVKISEERDPMPDVSIRVEHEGNTSDTSKSNTKQVEQCVNKTTVLDNDSKHGLESSKNTNDAMHPQNSPSNKETPNRDGIGDVAIVKECENTAANIGTSLDKKDKVPNEETKETNIDSHVTVVDTDESSEYKPNDVKIEASEMDTREEEAEGGSIHGHMTVRDSSDHVIVRDSSGAELFEKGRDSVLFDPDELMVQNDNFRISQLSHNY